MLLGNPHLPRFYPLCFLCIIYSPQITWQHHPQSWKAAQHKAAWAKPCAQGGRRPIATLCTTVIQPAVRQGSSPSSPRFPPPGCIPELPPDGLHSSLASPRRAWSGGHPSSPSENWLPAREGAALDEISPETLEVAQPSRGTAGSS